MRITVMRRLSTLSFMFALLKLRLIKFVETMNTGPTEGTIRNCLQYYGVETVQLSLNQYVER